MEKLFVYGTLKQAKVQKEILGRTIQGIQVSLANYTKTTIEIEGETYPFLKKQKDSYISGLILEISKEELLLLDEFETDAYIRKKKKLTNDTYAWVYCNPQEE
jgi:gamma-glutamylcyclotransferase (GGCT)/AIG2-like uncharacterized protein YtfP